MAIKHDIINYLLGSTGVTALVGTRIRPDVLHDSDTSLPSIVLSNLPGGETQDYMSGTDGLTRARIELRSYGATDLAASNVDLACYRVLHTFGGTMGSSSTVVTDLVVSEPFSVFERRGDGSQGGAHRYVRDLEVWYFQAVPTV